MQESVASELSTTLGLPTPAAAEHLVSSLTALRRQLSRLNSERLTRVKSERSTAEKLGTLPSGDGPS